jgi:site-specific DNA-methyltransferase (adenine-specific)
MISEIYNMDCMDYMRSLPDNFADLAIVDPPYGISINMNMGRKKGQKKSHTDKKWDDAIPSDDYFTELFRVSKNQIIWGGNYFTLPLTNSWIFWDKDVPTGVSFSDGELAWTSFSGVLRKAKIPYSGFRGSEGKIHPTQKPVALYNWVIKNYAGGGDKVILDTFLGSGSSRIAAYDLGFDFYACELDKDYFEAQEKRFNSHISQQKLFAPVPKEMGLQMTII